MSQRTRSCSAPWGAASCSVLRKDLLAPVEARLLPKCHPWVAKFLKNLEQQQPAKMLKQGKGQKQKEPKWMSQHKAILNGLTDSQRECPPPDTPTGCPHCQGERCVGDPMAKVSWQPIFGCRCQPKRKPLPKRSVWKVPNADSRRPRSSSRRCNELFARA